MTAKHKKPSTVPPQTISSLERAIRCGPIPVDLEGWKTKPIAKLTKGERVCRFALEHLVIPEGPKVGQKLVLEPEQVAFILAVFDNPIHTSKAILSMARRNGKTFVIAVILLAFIVGPLAYENSVIASAAMSRDQAALCFRLMWLMLEGSPTLVNLFKIIPSSKRIIGVRKNVEYLALSADARTGHGKSLRVLLLDEAGQIVEAENEYVSMLRTSQGSYDDALMLIVSTQAPSDASFLSLEIDHAINDRPKDVVCHLYSADDGCDILDEKQWRYANPGLGKYRSERDLERQLREALALPAKMPGVMNLLLNMRVSASAVFISPQVWKSNNSPVDLEVFRKAEKVVLGLDLSVVNDLTAAVACALDADGEVHAMTFAFTPLGGIKERSLRDRVPYDEWARTGVIYAPAGDTLDYDMICRYLRERFEALGVSIDEVQFDRFRIDVFKAAAHRQGFAQEAEYVPVGQGFVSMAPRLDALETALLQRRVRHGNNPVLNMAAANAIVERDNVGNRRPTKKKSAQKIDALVSLLMSAYPLIATVTEEADVNAMIG